MNERRCLKLVYTVMIFKNRRSRRARRLPYKLLELAAIHGVINKLWGDDGLAWPQKASTSMLDAKKDKPPPHILPIREPVGMAILIELRVRSSSALRRGISPGLPPPKQMKAHVSHRGKLADMNDRPIYPDGESL